MKSIMEQASSIMKAIEKAWDRAENPKEFTIKVFEKEERNFFGMSTKPAKIGIFFHDATTQQDKHKVKPTTHETKDLRPEPSIAKQPQHQQPPQQKKHPVVQPKVNIPSSAQKPRVEQQKTVALNSPAQSEQTTSSPHQAEQSKQIIPAIWTNEMIDVANDWVTKTLTYMGMETVTFESQPEGKNLKLTFAKPLIEDPAHEKILFRSFAHLIMSSLRNRYKQEIKNLKVILIRPQ